MTDTERDVIKCVQKHGQYMGNGFYSVSYNGKGYIAKDTRTLVLRICRDNNIPVPIRGDTPR